MERAFQWAAQSCKEEREAGCVPGPEKGPSVGLGLLEPAAARDLCLRGSSSKQVLWLHASAPSFRTCFWNPELLVVVSNTPVCKTPTHTPHTQLAEFTRDIAQSAPWQSFEVVVVTGKAARLQLKVWDPAAPSIRAQSRARQSGSPRPASASPSPEATQLRVGTALEAAGAKLDLTILNL